MDGYCYFWCAQLKQSTTLVIVNELTQYIFGNNYYSMSLRCMCHARYICNYLYMKAYLSGKKAFKNVGNKTLPSSHVWWINKLCQQNYFKHSLWLSCICFCSCRWVRLFRFSLQAYGSSGKHSGVQATCRIARVLRDAFPFLFHLKHPFTTSVDVHTTPALFRLRNSRKGTIWAFAAEKILN